MKVLELFAGIGACSKALERLGIEHEIVDAVEIDKYAIKSFNAIHNTNFEPQDITKWDKDIQVDLIMHGSPCQDFSVAGKNAGGDKDSGTRSSLMYETLRIVEKLKPEIVIWENVKNLWSKRHRHNWENYVNKMSELGYDSVGKVINARDCGIPQNRERLFTISIKRGSKLVDSFMFPDSIPLEKKLKDVLEENVDEKYYLSDKAINSLIYQSQKQKDKGNHFEFQPRDIDSFASCISTRSGQRKTDNFIRVKNATSEGYMDAYDGDGVDCSFLSSETRRGRVQHQMSQTIPATSLAIGVNDNMRIRKLTPIECWRLMGFDDEDFRKAEQINSNTQLYKQAGNSIVVNVLERIFNGFEFRV